MKSGYRRCNVPEARLSYEALAKQCAQLSDENIRLKRDEKFIWKHVCELTKENEELKQKGFDEACRAVDLSIEANDWKLYFCVSLAISGVLLCCLIALIASI